MHYHWKVYNGEDVVTSATLTLKANQSCIITCQAHNTHFNGSTTVTAQAKLTVNGQYFYCLNLIFQFLIVFELQ